MDHEHARETAEQIARELGQPVNSTGTARLAAALASTEQQPAALPIVSIGPSGIGGPYQVEIK